MTIEFRVPFVERVAVLFQTFAIPPLKKQSVTHLGEKCMQTEVSFRTRNLLTIAAMASFLSVVPLPSAFAAEAPGKALDPAEVQARQVWRETMHNLDAPASGCFHAAFPSTQWEEVACAAPSGYRSAIPKTKDGVQTTGNAFDVVAQTPSGHYFASVIGSFPETKGVKSEKGVGVPLFHDNGVLGPNEYTLQINTDIHHSAACDGYSRCKAWQQYVLSTNDVSITGKLTGKTEVFIEYWLFNYGVHNGRDICPSGYLDVGKDSSGPGDDCVQNSPGAVVYSGQIPITKLTSLELSASAKAGGTDAATAIYDGDAYKASVHDSLTDIASIWNQAEFNVVGNAGGSRADFNSGSALLVKMALSYGSTKAPTCESPYAYLGTTGETNNLTLTECAVEGGSKPVLEFIEEN
jgi:hypothetical protein